MKLKDAIKGTYEIVNKVVNVVGDVHLNHLGLTEIPWKFGTVTGCFKCEGNNLKSLKNAPVNIGLGFFVFKNKLISLKDSPTEVVGGVFNCANNELISLKGIPVAIGIICYNNPIETFNDIPYYMIQRIRGIEDYCPKLIKKIFVPVEKNIVEFEKPITKFKAVSLQERLESI